MIKMMNLFSAAEWISIEMKIFHGEKIDLDEIQERKLNQIMVNLLLCIDSIKIIQSTELIY